jgi:predicted ATPase
VGEVGQGGHQEPLALGETPHVAARLGQAAQPNTLVISSATQHLIEGYFMCETFGEPLLIEPAQPLPVYRVLRASGIQHRFGIAAVRGLTPLVGRAPEVELLVERWARVQEGLGQVVLLVGEAGIGKSRLVQVLRDFVAQEPHTRVEYRCSPYHQHSALSPVIAHLERALGWDRNATPQVKLQKLEEALAHHPWPQQEVVPLLADVLSLPLSSAYPPLTLTPERQKQKTLEALLTWLLAEAEQQPVLCIVEDLHWVDPSTLEWLSLVVEQSPTARLYGLFTCRPEFALPWSTRAHLTSLTLGRLSRTQIAQMVQSVAAGKALPADVLTQIVAQTDGVPLFVEELTKAVLECDLLREAEGVEALSRPRPPLAIPATLQGSLMARLDRLKAVKAVAQLGATIGRQFDYETLQAVASLDGDELQQGLRQLVEAEVVYQRGVPPRATYLFKHALMQDAAYQSLLKRTRQQYHQRIAQVLEERCPDTAVTQPELLAQHYTQAGLHAQAVGHWQRAGERAIRCSAHVEAIMHLTRGLEALMALPDTPARAQQELALQTTLGPALSHTKGYAALEVEQTYTRIRVLCHRLQADDTPQLFLALWGLWGRALSGSAFQVAHELAAQLSTLAQGTHDPALLIEAHMALGHPLFWRGEFAASGPHYSRGLALYDPQGHRSNAFRYGEDPGMVFLSYTAWTQWLLGYPSTGLVRMEAALSLAQQQAHPYSVVFALFFAACLHQLRWEGQAVQARAETIIALATEQMFPLWMAAGAILLGWARAVQGQAAEGIPQIRQGLDAWQATGAELIRPYFLGLLAEAHAYSGQTAEGLAVLAAASALVDKSGERFYAAELSRLKGELLLQSGGYQSGVCLSGVLTPHVTEAEACFQQAIAIARQQQARSLELRAAMSLSRLWRRQGKRTAAYELLAPVYHWFTEGFDTADLQEAKALIEALQG